MTHTMFTAHSTVICVVCVPRGTGNVILYVLFGTVVFEWTFGRCKKFKTDHVLSSRSFIFEKRRSGAAIQNGLTNNFAITFFGYLTKNLAIKIFCFRIFSFMTEKLYLDPKNIVFGMRWTWVAGCKWDFSEARNNNHKPKEFDVTFLLGSQKTLFWNCWSTRFGRKIPTSFFRDENPEWWRVTFVVFSQRPEVISVIVVTIESMNNDGLYVRPVLEVSILDERHYASLLPSINKASLLKNRLTVPPCTRIASLLFERKTWINSTSYYNSKDLPLNIAPINKQKILCLSDEMFMSTGFD